MMLIRRRWWSPLWLGVLVVALLLGRALNRGRDDWSGPIAFAVIVTVAPAGFFLARLLFRRHLRRWAVRGGWTEVDPDERPWPWQPHAASRTKIRRAWQPQTGGRIKVRRAWQPQAGGRIKVRRAWQREIDGLPVTFGELSWKNTDFDGTASQHRGKGAFVIVRLPQTQPPMTLRHTFEPVGDSPRLEQPALLEAYLAGEIGPWAVRNNELFTIEPRDAWLDPDMADQAVRRALRAVQLLDLGPDAAHAEPR
uniref:hypothetical protein n=1 Tax=Paractinoplanes polyasparticus TaxID=2856853 RepID=UPI001C84A681|nr:hypothetical protein [Actinoplanes polyasparticus]